MEACVSMSDAPICERDGWTMLRHGALAMERGKDDLPKAVRLPSRWVCPLCALAIPGQIKHDKPEVWEQLKKEGFVEHYGYLDAFIDAPKGSSWIGHRGGI